MEATDQLHQLLRTQILRGVVLAVDDTGAAQTVTVRTHYGVVRAQVEVAQTYGLSAHVPLDGAIAHVFANAGDPADLVAIVAYNPNVARMGNLAEGETCLYDRVGQKIYLHDGKIVRVDAAREMQVRIAGRQVLTVTADGAQLEGTLRVTKDVVVGKNKLSFVGHGHGWVKRGSDKTGGPQS